MIKSLQISNFRCFKEVALKDCRTLNVIVGENGSGKTALLESIFLAAGPNPEIVMRLRQWRGIEALIGGYDPLDEALWGDLFHNFDMQLPVSVALTGSLQIHSRTLRISYGQRSRSIPIFRKDIRPPSFDVPLRFVWQTSGHEPVVIEPRIEDNKLKFEPLVASSIFAAFFSQISTYPTLEIATRLSNLNKSGRKEWALKYFQAQYPQITDLSVEIASGIPIIHAAGRKLPGRMPINLVSGGMTKIAAILLTIAHKENGIVIVDEIENGVHHKLLPGLWKTLVSICREMKVQMFVSTHSQECLDALREIAESSLKDELSIIRVYQEDERSLVRSFSGEKAASAILGGVELRG